MGNILKKNFPCAECQHCGKITDIQMSGDYRRLIAQIKTFKDLNKLEESNLSRVLQSKNGQIQKLHQTIAKLRNLMTPKQIKQAKEISQQMRDELKKAESLLTK